MKAIKYLLIGAALAGFSATSIAQNDNKATIETITKIIKNKSGLFDLIFA